MRIPHRIWGGIALVVILGGCASLPTPSSSQAPSPPQPSAVLSVTEPEPGIPIPTQPPAPGTIFGKTHFKGVLKTSYVKLSLVDLVDETKQYQLFIGDQLGPNILPWNTRSVEPGYFFLELPAGSYRIYSISIPVGSTTATEDIGLTFEVASGQVTYIGTLEVNGINEKVKFGGVPILVPGFDYVVNVLDEREEALQEYHHRYPLDRNPVQVKLIQNEGIHRKVQ